MAARRNLIAEQLADTTMTELVLGGRIAKAMTRLPPELGALSALQTLDLRLMPALESLDGIAKLTTLRSLRLHEVPALDLERAFAQLGDLPELAELTLEGACFTRLPKAIAKLHSMLELTLVDTPKLDFAEGFKRLGKLEFLRSFSLIQRSRVTLPDAFAPLTQVRTLSIMFRFITLPPSIGSMASLEKLDLERNRFKALPSTLGKLSKLVELNLDGSKLATLPDELCRCTALEVLDLSSNPLRMLPECIGDLVNLKSLDVGDTRLKQFPAGVAELANLRVLRVPNELATLPTKVFALQLDEFSGPDALAERFTLREVETPDEDELYLDDPDRIPADLGQPIELRLDLPLDTPMPQLAKLRRLKRLDLEHVAYDLDHVLPFLARIGTLESLSIDGEYKTLPASIGGLASLRELYLTAPLTSLPRELGALAQLATLHLTSVKLATLGGPLTELVALEELRVLMSRARATIPTTIGKLAALKSLEVHVDTLGALPIELARCAKLESIRLGLGRGGKAIPNLEILARLPALTSISLDRVNKLDLPALFVALENSAVVQLDLASCEFKKLPKQIGLLTKLQRLNLEHTGIATLPPELRACVGLRSVGLTGYQIDNETRTRIKDFLPPGRWKKQARSSSLWYTRTD